ncbi:MAG: hypothetical protein JWN04_4625 [Myxococcaceae bacterium]|nr:hypothetical protein [Myxococcaceae bacterium]
MDDASTKDVCPQGLQCRAGRCQGACRTDVPDVCDDGIDNDCDGKIDEVDSLGRETCGDHIDNDCDGMVDEGSDGDDDGYSWCGDTVGDATTRKPRDCDDSLSSVHPGAAEICDGRDNDCDDIIDEETPGTPLCQAGASCLGQRCVIASCANEAESALSCPPGERCDAQTGQCVSQQCANVTCGADEYCDTTTNSCRARGKQDNGSPCSDDVDCNSGLCIDAAALRFASGMRVCGQACCSDQQCGTGQRCFASGTGARSCLPIGLIPPASPRECTSDSGCASSEICSLSRDHNLSGPTFIERAAVIASTCRTNALAIGLHPGDRCSTYPECATFACVPSYPFGSMCSNPCGSSNDCTELAAAAKSAGALGAYCRYTDVTLDNSPVDYAAICVVRRLGETGQGVYGAECSSASDCLDAGCVGATARTKGHCTSTCCSDAQCGPREDGKPIACRPFAFGAATDSAARYEMRCDI